MNDQKRRMRNMDIKYCASSRRVYLTCSKSKTYSPNNSPLDSQKNQKYF